MISIKEAIERNKILRENGVLEHLKQMEERPEIVKLEDEKADFIKNFTTRKTFTTMRGETITRRLYSFEADYPSPKQKEIIFTHGKTNYTLWFLNAKKKLCVVDRAQCNDDGNIYLNIMIDANENRKQTSMTLDRFLSLVKKGEFTITLKKFVDTYLKDITESNYYKNKLAEFDNRIAEVKAKNDIQHPELVQDKSVDYLTTGIPSERIYIASGKSSSK